MSQALIEAMKSTTPKGMCIACERPLPKSRTKPRVLCRDPDCYRLYRMVWAMGKRAEQKQERTK